MTSSSNLLISQALGQLMLKARDCMANTGPGKFQEPGARSQERIFKAGLCFSFPLLL